MVKRCVLCGVVDHVMDVSVHGFPRGGHGLQWVAFVENHGVIVNHTSKLCSRHFVPELDYVVGDARPRRLLPTAVPSLDGLNYQGNIRQYNNALAFAAITTSVNPRPLPGRGPAVFRLQGQVYHRTNNDVAANREDARYCELYFIESGEANARRLDMARQRNRHELSESVMADLDTLLRDRNPYALALIICVRCVAGRKRPSRRRPSRCPRLITMHFVADATRDQRCCNLPTANEVAAVFVGDDGRPPRNLNLVIYDTNPIDPQHRMQNIHAGSCHTDPMLYPLLFPSGEAGWHFGMRQEGNRRNQVRNRNSIREFACFRLAIRYRENNDTMHVQFSLIHAGRFLLQQYICDQYVRMESNNLNYVRSNQRALLAEAYQGLMDHVNQQHHLDMADPIAVGRRVILPSTFVVLDSILTYCTLLWTRCGLHASDWSI